MGLPMVLYTEPKSRTEFRNAPLSAHPCLSALHHLVVVKLNIHDAVLRNRLHRHALEVDGHPPLQLVRTHVQDLDTLAEGDVGVVVFVEDRETVVSTIQCMR